MPASQTLCQDLREAVPDRHDRQRAGQRARIVPEDEDLSLVREDEPVCLERERAQLYRERYQSLLLEFDSGSKLPAPKPASPVNGSGNPPG